MHHRRRPQFVAAIALLLTFGVIRPLPAENDWSNFRGPLQNGVVAGSQLPLSWSEQEHVRWKTAIDGKAWSSPVIWENRIYLTNSPAEGSRYSVICVDADSGKVVYDKRLYSVPLPQYCHPFNSYASPSPVVEQGRLYVSFGSPYNACLDSNTGEVIWARTDFVCNHFRGPGSSPFLYRDKLFLQFDGSDQQYVVALDKATGKTVWRTDRTVEFDDIDPATGQPERQGDWRKAYSTPLIAEVGGKPLLISLGSMALYAYEPDTGREVWRLEFVGSHSGACRPVFSHGLIYACTGSGGELWAVRPQGTGVLSDQSVVWKHKRTVPRRPSILVVDDLIFMVDDSGVAKCLTAADGQAVWEKRLGGNFSSSPIFANGRVYFFDEDGKASVVKAARDFELLATNQLDDGFMASPAVAGNAMFLRTRSHLYRIEE